MDNNAACIAFDEQFGIEFPCISAVEGGGDAINNTYDIYAYPTYILIAPDHSIVEQDMWPIPNTQQFITYFESNGLEQAECGTTSVTAAFGSNLTEVCEMEQITYEDLSTGNVTGWTWTFEGGDPATSNEQNPMVNYSAEGEYDVTLEVSDGTETNTVNMENYVTVFAIPATMLEVFDDACLDDPEFELTGGTPVGGEYSGTGVTDGWFYPDIAGVGTHTITYTYTSENDCVNFAEQTIVVDDCTGITEFGDQLMQLYPNPSTGVFEIELNYQGSFSIQIYSIVGTMAYKIETSANGYYHNTIDLSELESGIYFVSFKSADDTIVKKLKLLSK